MSVQYEKTDKVIDYLKSVEISIKSDFLHADKSEGFIYRSINDKDRPYLNVVKQDGVVSGVVVVRPIDKNDYKSFKKIEIEQDALILDKLVIKSWHRNLGLGTGLVDFVKQTYGQSPLYALVRQDPQKNIYATKIFDKTGFVVVGQATILNKDFNDEATWAMYKLETTKKEQE